ncbi:hypothetical protein FRC07_000373 [Ceratobasidium sp. 392]|nr:hypothetical protein FRC07_000373 [Ceratobasidium sp. 392]
MQNTQSSEETVRSVVKHALFQARKAVELDKQKAFELAIPAYAECVKQLDRALKMLPADKEEARRAMTIRNTYCTRMEILSLITKQEAITAQHENGGSDVEVE